MVSSWRQANGFKEISELPLTPKPEPLRGPDELHVIEGAHGDPLEIFREGLALARRAGMSWWQALGAAWVAALSVESDKQERELWADALISTLAAWRSAYERRDTGCAL
jgi:hypothetical protein